MSYSRIGVMTSGGDAPGMNAAVRAVVRMGNHLNVEVLGIENGFQGLLEGQIEFLDSRRVSGIERLGGTILGTSRSAEFRSEQGVQRAMQNLDQQNVEALVVIGGEGSLKGAYSLHQKGFPVVLVPASIDNDVGGTAVAIGVDTAINTALEAIDRLKDTAAAFRRSFVVEVMGRRSGWIALQSAIAAGVDLVLVPEVPPSMEAIIQSLKQAKASGKTHFVLLAAEGISPTATEIHRLISQREDVGFESRLTILGHIQRGGSPSAFDRLLASRLGARAVEELDGGRPGTVIGFRSMTTVTTPLETAINEPSAFSQEIYRFAQILAG